MKSHRKENFYLNNEMQFYKENSFNKAIFISFSFWLILAEKGWGGKWTTRRTPRLAQGYLFELCPELVF